MLKTLSVVLLVVVASCAAADRIDDASTQSADPSTTTTHALAVTSEPPRPSVVTVQDPAITRPAYGEFGLLRIFDPEISTFCATRYPLDDVGCYDALAAGQDNFPAVVRQRLDAAIDAMTAGSPRYSAAQYGCHSDGRCLDDYDVWCTEDEIIYDDVNQLLMCESTYERLSNP